MTERAVHGDFHVIRMDGLFHVVFRPDADPEWFRIIGSFYTYERAWIYCDIERVSVWSYRDKETGKDEPESTTGDEEVAGLRPAPVISETVSALNQTDDLPAMLRDVYESTAESDGPMPPSHPMEDFSDHPREGEEPKDYHRRQFDEAVARPSVSPPIAAVEPTSDEAAPHEALADPMDEAARDLSDAQWSVLKFFRDHVGDDNTVRASFKTIADEAGVAVGSAPFLIEVLEKKGFITKEERGTAKSATLWRLHTADELAAAGDNAPKCKDCGGPRSIGSAGQCRACYQKQLADLPDGVVAQLSQKGQAAVAAASNA